MPVGIFNEGNTCFLNALVQCISHSPSVALESLQNSQDDLDVLVKSVLVAERAAPTVRGAVSLKTSLIHKVFGCPVGCQGQQDPCIFFTEICASDGVLASKFRSSMTEALMCVECNAILGEPQILCENYVHMLKYKADTKAATICDLFVRNSTSDSIEGYKSPAHTKNKSSSKCEASMGVYQFRYFEGKLPELLCFSLSSRITNSRNFPRGSSTSSTLFKDCRYFEPGKSISLPETNMFNKKLLAKDKSVTNVLYTLYATIVHEGQGPHNGHYSAYIRQEDQWFHVVYKLHIHEQICPPVLMSQHNMHCVWSFLLLIPDDSGRFPFYLLHHRTIVGFGRCQKKLH